ncbi:MAG: HAD family hydrolase [Opitutales bacterium]|nr:HAD family hydrolase [Opitutales bacterium]
MKRTPTAALFDLDGTLIDHFRVIYRCYCYALERLGLPPVSFEKVKASVGGSIVVTFGKLIASEHVPEAVGLFRTHFKEIWADDITVLAGAEPFLEKLRGAGVACGVLTNKEGDASRRILSHVGLDRHLKFTLGTLDTPYRKPEAAFSEEALCRLGTSARETCLIGDSPYDIAAARVVGMRAYAVATGSHSVEELRETEASGVFANLNELAQAVFGLELGPCFPVTHGRARALPIRPSGAHEC